VEIIATPLPDNRKKGVKVCLEAVEFAPDNHAFFGSIAVPVFYHHVNIDSGLVFIWTGNMEFPGFHCIGFLHDRIFHMYILCICQDVCKGPKE
jgi:hypothetical protein